MLLRHKNSSSMAAAAASPSAESRPSVTEFNRKKAAKGYLWVLSHTWVADGTPDGDDGPNKPSKLKWLEQNLNTMCPNKGWTVNNGFMDWRDLPPNSMKEVKAAVNDLYSSLPMLIMPSHKAYFYRGWCLTELLLNMLSGKTPLVPPGFDIPLAEDVMELIFPLLLAEKLRKFARLFFCWSKAKVTVGKDAAELNDMLCESIKNAEHDDLKHALIWAIDQRLQWTVPNHEPDAAQQRHKVELTPDVKHKMWEDLSRKLEQVFTDKGTDDDRKDGFEFSCVLCRQKRWMLSELQGQHICFECFAKVANYYDSVNRDVVQTLQLLLSMDPAKIDVLEILRKLKLEPDKLVELFRKLSSDPPQQLKDIVGQLHLDISRPLHQFVLKLPVEQVEKALNNFKLSSPQLKEVVEQLELPSQELEKLVRDLNLESAAANVVREVGERAQEVAQQAAQQAPQVVAQIQKVAENLPKQAQKVVSRITNPFRS